MKKINKDILLQFLTALGFLVSISYLLISGHIENYVHPRWNFYLWLSCIILILILISLWEKLFFVQRKARLPKAILNILPIIAILIFPNNVALANQITNVQQTNTGISNKNYKREAVAGVEKIYDDEFLTWYYYIQENPEEYEDRQVSFLAQIYIDERMNKNEFLLSRKAMVCCAADMVSVGFFSQYDKKTFNNLEWVYVKGKVKNRYTDFWETTVPTIEIESIETTDPPKVEIVYP